MYFFALYYCIYHVYKGVFGNKNDDPNITYKAAQKILQTTLDILDTGVALSDVQVLVDPERGNILFIDMTEATVY